MNPPAATAEPTVDFLEALLTRATDAIYFKDERSRFLRANHALARALRAPDPAAVLGRTDADFFSAEHAGQARADELAIMRGGEPMLDVEEKETFADGEVRWASTSKFPLLDSAGRVVGTFGFSRDITERKRAEETLARVQRELIDAERRAAVADFAEVMFFHFNQLSSGVGEIVDRLAWLLDAGRGAAMRARTEELLARLPPSGPEADACVNLLAEAQINADAEQQVRKALLALRARLRESTELVALERGRARGSVAADAAAGAVTAAATDAGAEPGR